MIASNNATDSDARPTRNNNSARCPVITASSSRRSRPSGSSSSSALARFRPRKPSAVDPTSEVASARLIRTRIRAATHSAVSRPEVSIRRNAFRSRPMASTLCALAAALFALRCSARTAESRAV